MPDTFRDKTITDAGISIPDNIEVVVLPRSARYCTISVSRKSQLKEVYYSGDMAEYNPHGDSVYLQFYDHLLYGNNETVKDVLDITLYYTSFKPNATDFDNVELKSYQY